jgi:hypothetical protein
MIRMDHTRMAVRIFESKPERRRRVGKPRLRWVEVENEVLCLLGYNTMRYSESKPTFRRNISPPSSGLKSKQELQARFLLAHSSNLKICSFETSINFNRTTWIYEGYWENNFR